MILLKKEMLKDPWFWFCEFMAVAALWNSLWLIALIYGIAFPLLSIAYYWTGRFRNGKSETEHSD